MKATEESTKISTSLYLLSLLGALGTGLQNFLGVSMFIQGLMSASFAASQFGWALINGLATFFGGVCSTAVNFCINIKLLEDFYNRLKNWRMPPGLTAWEKFQYWGGTAVFIVSGILYGLTAMAFGPVGPWMVLTAAAGIFVSLITIPQELETWLSSFDSKPIEAQDYASPGGYRLGKMISFFNVIALSLLFTAGLTSFFVGLGVPALPALGAGLGFAFTGGAFTEYFFYSTFLPSFCGNFAKKWEAIMSRPYPMLGLGIGSSNATVNGVLGGVGIFYLLPPMIAAAGLAAPPALVLFGAATVLGSFAGAASFILGMDFWIENSIKLVNYFKKEEAPSLEGEPSVVSFSNDGIMPSLSAANQKTVSTVPVLPSPTVTSLVPPSQKLSTTIATQFGPNPHKIILRDDNNTGQVAANRCW